MPGPVRALSAMFKWNEIFEICLIRRLLMTWGENGMRRNGYRDWIPLY
jgi:hypothetical protein